MTPTEPLTDVEIRHRIAVFVVAELTRQGVSFGDGPTFDPCEFAERLLSTGIILATALKAENERLREALEPFLSVAAILDALPPGYIVDDDEPLRKHLPGVWPTVGDLRRAAKVLEG